MDVPELDPAEVLERLAQVVLVDVRDPGSFRRGHLPGARSVLDHDVDDFVATADKARPVVVYCYHGVSSLGGAAYFLEHGFREVYSMRGGYAAWTGPKEQAPEAQRAPPPPRSRPGPAPRPPSRRERWLKRLRSLAGRK